MALDREAIDVDPREGQGTAITVWLDERLLGVLDEIRVDRTGEATRPEALRQLLESIANL